MCNREIDTLPFIEENIERNKFYNVPDLTLIKDEYVFRSWSGNSCVEVVKNGEKLLARIYFAAEGFNKKRFTKIYNLSNEVAQNLYSWVNGLQYKRRENVTAVAHTFEIKQNSSIETYTTDSPQLDYKIWEIISIDKDLDRFDKDIPFEKYTFWQLIQEAKSRNEEPWYLTKGNER